MGLLGSAEGGGRREAGEGGLRLRGGGVPRAEKRFRRKQAQEQREVGIGKSMWRREKDRVSQREKRRENIMSEIKAKAAQLGKNAAVFRVRPALQLSWG